MMNGSALDLSSQMVNLNNKNVSPDVIKADCTTIDVIHRPKDSASIRLIELLSFKQSFPPAQVGVKVSGIGFRISTFLS